MSFIHRLKQRVVPFVVSRVPRGWMDRWVAVPPMIAYYHIVSDDAVPHVQHLYRFRNTKEFTADLDAFLKSYLPLSLDDLMECVRRDKPVPPRSFMVTFDDGFREVHEVVAPILLRKGVPATFFLCSGFVDNRDMAFQNKLSLILDQLSKVPSPKVERRLMEILAKRGFSQPTLRAALLAIEYPDRELVATLGHEAGCDLEGYAAHARPYLSSDQVRNMMTMGFSFGAHSIDHPRYTVISLEEQVRQTSESLRFVKDQFQPKHQTFAFPHGGNDVSAAFFEAMARHGTMDLSFGTAGLMRDVVPRHFHRCSFEYRGDSAAEVLSQNLARGLAKRLAGRQVVQRS